MIINDQKNKINSLQMNMNIVKDNDYKSLID